MSVSPITAARDTRQRSLWDATAAVAGRLNRAHADLVDLTAELIRDRHWGDGGFSTPEHYLVVRAGLSPGHAADIVRVAKRLTELPAAAAALVAGELSLDQVAVLARHVPTSHQASVTGFARNATVPQLRRAVTRHAFPATPAPPQTTPNEPEPVDPRAEVERAHEAARGSAAEDRACARPDLTMSYDADGRFQLRYSAPATIGALVEQAVKEAKDALFTRSRDTADQDCGQDTDQVRDGAATRVDPNPDGNAGLPTYADALEEMATRSLASITSTSRSAHYRVYLHLDTSGAWATGGHAIPLRLLGRFLSDGAVQPVWETEGNPVNVGRTMRILPAHSRRLITDRDRGCRFPGCTTTRFLEIHHLTPWTDGGTTDTNNQISLCTTHHDGIDRGDHTITGDPTAPDGLTVTNRYGLPIRPPRPNETAPPPQGDPHVPPDTYQPPSGGPITWTDVELPSDHELPTTPPTTLTLTPAPGPEAGLHQHDPADHTDEPFCWLDDPANPDRGLIHDSWHRT